MTGRIFINYRRGDEPGFAGRLFDRLEQSFKSDQLFLDVDNIPPGRDFTAVLASEVSKCDVLLVIIGRDWLTSADERGRRRLDRPDDFVRIEIESGLLQGKRVIPILINNVEMPRAEVLPESLKPLARRHAVRLTHERFKVDAESLVKTLKQALEEAEAEKRTPPARTPASLLRDADETPGWFSALKSGDPALILGLIGAVGGVIAFSAPLNWAMMLANGRSVMWTPPVAVAILVSIGFMIWGGAAKRTAPIAAVVAGVAWFLSDFAITTSPLISEAEWQALGGIPALSYFIWGAANGLAVIAALSFLVPSMRTPLAWLVAIVATGVGSLPFGVQSPLVPVVPGALTIAMAMAAVGIGLRANRTDA